MSSCPFIFASLAFSHLPLPYSVSLHIFRELGYKTEQEHIRDCQLIEQRKRKQMLRIEEERTKIQQRQQELLAQGDDEGLEMTEAKPLDELTSRDAGDLLGVEREEEEDEELAMARAIEEEQKEVEMNGADNEPIDESPDADASPLQAGDDDDDDDAFPSADNDDDIDRGQGDSSPISADLPIADGTGDTVEKAEQTVKETPIDNKAENDAAVPSSLEGDDIGADTKAPTGDEEEEHDDATVEKRMVDDDEDDATVDKGEPVATMSDTTEVKVPETIGITSEEQASESPAPAVADAGIADAAVEEKVGGDDDQEVEFDATNEDKEEDADDSSKPKKPKNSAWQAMLKKEAEMLKKQKGRKSNGMLDMEADEEEDEEGVMGLEDFGFAAPDKKKDDDDEGDDQLDDDDLENVVDDLSDNEGDEEAGEAARRAAAAREEKERHKDIMRRMREGYDGRRGGVAGGGSARGNLRFDQLVAADNREDAKRLGLLNEDEFDSDNEGGEGGKKEGDDEIEDETALLDQMLKDRFLQRDKEEELEESFSGDEEEEDPDEGGEGKITSIIFCLSFLLFALFSLHGKASIVYSPTSPLMFLYRFDIVLFLGGAGSDAEEDREQERLAKRFAKRARMQRLIENHGRDEEFSQARLIDEDATMQKDLKSMRNALSRKRGHISSSSNLGSTNSRLGGADSDSHLPGAKKLRRNSGSSDDGAAANSGSKNNTSSSQQRSAFANCGSLSIALRANKTAGKRKSSFLSSGSGKNPTLGRSSSATVSKSVSLSHVLFQTGEASQSSQLPRSTSLGASSLSRGANSRSGFGATSNKRAKTSGSGSQSLWSAVTTNSFQKRVQ